MTYKNSLAQQYFQQDASLDWAEVEPGIQRKLYGHDEHAMMVRVKFEKGAIGSLHQHAHTQVSYVESGVFELEIDGLKQVLNAGDGYFVPSGKLHGCICLENGVLVDFFTPERKDFL